MFLLLVAVCVLGNVIAYRLVLKSYAQARTAAVFPSHESRNPGKNGALGPKTERRIVLFGDSRIEQWRNFPRPADAEVINSGIGGETTAQMRIRFERDVLALKPDIVVLQLGINDLVAIGALPDRQAEIVSQCGDNTRYFVDTLQSRGIRTVLLTVIPPATPPIWRLPVWSREIAVEVERLNRSWLAVRSSPALSVVDTASLLKDADGHWHDGVVADALHITPRGYEYLNAAVAPLLQH